MSGFPYSFVAIHSLVDVWCWFTVHWFPCMIALLLAAIRFGCTLRSPRLLWPFLPWLWAFSLMVASRFSPGWLVFSFGCRHFPHTQRAPQGSGIFSVDFKAEGISGDRDINSLKSFNAFTRETFTNPMPIQHHLTKASPVRQARFNGERHILRYEN